MPHDTLIAGSPQSPSTEEWRIAWWPHDFMDTDWQAFRGRSSAHRMRILDKSGGACWYCGAEIDAATMHMDHLVPLKQGGRDALDNIVPACPTCNMSKGSKSIEEWRVKAGRKYVYQDVPWFSAAQVAWLEGQGFQFPPIPYVVFWFESHDWQSGTGRKAVS